MLFGSVALLSSLADFTTDIHFDCEKAEQENAPNICHIDGRLGSAFFKHFSENFAFLAQI